MSIIIPGQPKRHRLWVRPLCRYISPARFSFTATGCAILVFFNSPRCHVRFSFGVSQIVTRRITHWLCTSSRASRSDRWLDIYVSATWDMHEMVCLPVDAISCLSTVLSTDQQRASGLIMVCACTRSQWLSEVPNLHVKRTVWNVERAVRRNDHIHLHEKKLFSARYNLWYTTSVYKLLSLFTSWVMFDHSSYSKY
jgi:hypothetical protein